MKKLIWLLIFILSVSFVQAENVTVKGIVLDSLDNLVGGAELKADCLEGEIFTTDKFGSFLIENVPKGSCRIYANFKEGVGFKDIDIINQTIDLEIKLDKTIVKISKDHSLTIFLVVVFLFLILLWLYFKLFKKEKKLEKKEKREEREIKGLKQGRIKDILKTLNAKERKVVEFLLENNYKGSQAKIRHNTGITRTSLARCLKGLEAKNIVSIERLGKLVKVKLTKWALGKE